MGDQFDIRGSSFTGSALGSGATVNNNGSVPSVQDLLTALAGSREEIAGAAPEADRQEVRDALARIEDELRRDDPRPAVVGSRWNTVTSLIGTLSEPVTKVAELVTKLFG
ncbi:hypothetical protein VA596_13835 [Amycolatopsis sp., V23-08]|uniref:DUF4404 family protein n=1 Tax=Amycolatopsis heterodermiae TaxID=3110235 RepID=A0ABU5R4K4_9PSEU|nr:hypothetical protein [Amycolatopsis sp., V23-08]MEA5360624.1 hypothetical protein [Amycolatopsis sp., V23-08]